MAQKKEENEQSLRETALSTLAAVYKDAMLLDIINACSVVTGQKGCEQAALLSIRAHSVAGALHSSAYFQSI